MIERIKIFFSELRHDTEALVELRQLLFGLVIVAGIVFVFHSLYVQKKQKTQAKLITQEQELKSTLGNGEVEAITAGQLQTLKKKETSLQERIDLLRFKESMYREQYGVTNDEESFANVIFTLLPRSPVDIEGKFAKMSVLEKRSHEYFSVYPVNIHGDSFYKDVLKYLQYVENRPEVGMINKLSLEQLEKTSFGQRVQVHFDLVLGRVQLK